MKIGVPNQTSDRERRVALAPAVVKRLTAAGLTVLVQDGAGRGAHHSDEEYRAAGAEITGDENAIWSADVVVTVQPPTVDHCSKMRRGAVFAGVLDPIDHHDAVAALSGNHVTAFAMEFIPRTTRAQAMDILSSQANMGGYKAVLLAANHSAKMFPLMMTAAGTVAPAKVFVIGAGVAGLQAIATAKRLGAVVEAFDIRPAVEEQIKSLGARFVKIDLGAEDAETAGGYAKELTPEQRQKQTELMQNHIIGADCVITTAAVFGKAPPMLIPQAVVEKMQPGSIIIDLAADEDAGRGNCELTKPGECYTTERGVIIDGSLNLPSALAIDASAAFANNMHAFLKEFIADGELKLNLTEEIQNGALITHDGHVYNTLVRERMGIKEEPPAIQPPKEEKPEVEGEAKPDSETPPESEAATQAAASQDEEKPQSEGESEQPSETAGAASEQKDEQAPAASASNDETTKEPETEEETETKQE